MPSHLAVCIALASVVAVAVAQIRWETTQCPYDNICELSHTRVVQCIDNGQSPPAVVSESLCTDQKPPTSCGLEFGKLYDFEFGAAVTETNGALLHTVFFPNVNSDTDPSVRDALSQTDGQYQYFSGPTPTWTTSTDAGTALTGPEYDHTLGFTSGGNDTSGHYYFLEASAPEPDGRWYFDSPPIDSDNFAGSCDVTFWLSGVGTDLDLKDMRFHWIDCASAPLTFPSATAHNEIGFVDARSAFDANHNFWGDGNDVQMWRQISFTVPPNNGVIRVRWDGRMTAASPKGDWAIDDIMFSTDCGAPTPSPLPSLSHTSTPSHTTTPSQTPSGTATPSRTPSVTDTPSQTASSTGTPSQTASSTGTPSATPSTSPTRTATTTSTSTPTQTPTRTRTSSGTSSPSPSVTPTIIPTNSHSPTTTPSHTPSPTSTPSQTASASTTPSVTPSPSSSATASSSVTSTTTSSTSATSSTTSSTSATSSLTSSSSATPSITPSGTPTISNSGSISASHTPTPTLADLDTSFFHSDLRGSDFATDWRFILFIVAGGLLTCCCCWYCLAAAVAKRSANPTSAV